MALVGVEVRPTSGSLPTRVANFLSAANRRIDAFIERRVDRPLHSFVPSDFELVWRMLDAIARLRLAPGRAFCEWGCGFAAVAGLAEIAGFEACGIDIEKELVAEARHLARDHALSVEIVHGNFVPQDAGALADCLNEFTWLSEAGPDGHSALGRDPSDFDLIFAYPWPGEEDVIFRLFDAFAATDALLLTYGGMEGLRVDRKRA